MDKIHMRDFTVSCIIGTQPKERIHKQDVVLNLTLEADMEPSFQSDSIEDTVNYKDLKDELFEMIESSEFFLIERLAECVAERCLSLERVARVRVVVDKPGALTHTRSVAVDIERPRRV